MNKIYYTILGNYENSPYIKLYHIYNFVFLQLCAQWIT